MVAKAVLAFAKPELSREQGSVQIGRCLRLLRCIRLSADRRLSLAKPLKQHSCLFKPELLRAGS